MARILATAFLIAIAGCRSLPCCELGHVFTADVEVSFAEERFVIRRGTEVLFRSEPMADVTFFDPEFFGDGTHLLMLADFGSEDSWGIRAIDLTSGKVRDLGTIDVVRAPDIEYYRSALPVARVFARPGGYVIEFAGEVLDADGRKVLARQGQRAVFVQRNDRFVLRGVS